MNENEETLLHEINLGGMVARIWGDPEDPFLPMVSIARRTEVQTGERSFIHWRYRFCDDELHLVAELAALVHRWISNEYLPNLRRERRA